MSTVRRYADNIFSSFNSPIRVAATDTVTLFVLSLAIIFSAEHLHRMAGQTDYRLDFMAVATSQLFFVMMAGAISWFCTSEIQKREKVPIRSVSRTVWSTFIVAIGGALLGGILFGAAKQLFNDPLTILDAIGAFGVILAPIGYRLMGFVEEKQR